ncbi:MAG TPA: hypothetical protein VGK54_03020 [Chloroflexota bacterium]
MEPTIKDRRRILSGILGSVRRAAAMLAGRPDQAYQVSANVADRGLGLMGGSWATPTELGLDLDGARSPAWHRTDLAVYSGYENGWGKAEREHLEDGNATKLTRGRIVSRKASRGKAA